MPAIRSAAFFLLCVVSYQGDEITRRTLADPPAVSGTSNNECSILNKVLKNYSL